MVSLLFSKVSTIQLRLVELLGTYWLPFPSLDGLPGQGYRATVSPAFAFTGTDNRGNNRSLDECTCHMYRNNPKVQGNSKLSQPPTLYPTCNLPLAPHHGIVKIKNAREGNLEGKQESKCKARAESFHI
jgi:hypothetical protein